MIHNAARPSRTVTPRQSAVRTAAGQRPGTATAVPGRRRPWRSLLGAAAEVPGQEPLGRRVEAQPVLWLGEAVPLVGEQHVLVVDPGRLQGGHDLLGLG